MAMLLTRKLISDIVFIVLLVFAFVIQLPWAIVVSYLFAVVYVNFQHKQIFIKPLYLLTFSSVGILCLFAALNQNHGVAPIFYLALTPFLYFSARHFVENSLDHVVSCLASVYWIFVLAVAVCLVQNWGSVEPLGAIFPWSSTNGLPSYLIVVQVAYSLAYYLKKDRLPVISSVATLVVACFGLGRGSIIVGVIICVISCLVNLTIANSSVDRRVVSRLFLVISLPLVFYLYANIDSITSAIELAFERSKFAGGVLDEPRALIVSDYLSKIGGWELLFGASYADTSIVKYYGGNPHNSYIRVHSFYGIVGLLAVFAPLAVIWFSKRPSSQKFVFIVFICIALLRAGTEPIFFPSTLDFFYFLYYLIFFRFSKMHDENDLIATNAK